MKKDIIVLGANGAWQKTLFFKEFVLNSVNRSYKMSEMPSGKGINFSRAVNIYNLANCKLLQFSGGENGERISKKLREEKFNFLNVHTQNPTRCCTTCLCEKTNTMTELIEPSFPASKLECDEMISLFESELKSASAGAFCGTLPTGTNPELYLEIASILERYKLPLLVDCFVDVLPILKKNIDIYLKINREELFSLTNKNNIIDAFKELFNITNVKYAAITDGAETSWLCDGKSIWKYHIKRVENVINPIGCGDTASAVWFSSILSGVSVEEAFKNALGAASANCLNEFPGNFKLTDAQDFASKIILETIKFK